MRERLSPYDDHLSAQTLPENISARESRAYLISLFVPFQPDKDANKCEKQAKSFRQLEVCFFEKGRDIFGNEIEFVQFEGGSFYARNIGPFQGPRFAVVLTTDDGSKFVAQLSFLPGGL